MFRKTRPPEPAALIIEAGPKVETCQIFQQFIELCLDNQENEPAARSLVAQAVLCVEAELSVSIRDVSTVLISSQPFRTIINHFHPINTIMKSFYCLIIVLTISSCQQTNSGEALSDEQFVDVYVAMLEQDVRSNPAGTTNDSTLSRPAQSVLNEYGVSEEGLRAKVESYRADPKKWQTFFEQVTKRLSQRIEEERVKKADSSAGNPEQRPVLR